jgi:ribosomal peptide maturation radical SAM protein 1
VIELRAKVAMVQSVLSNRSASAAVQRAGRRLENPRVALVCMPFTSARWPSIQLGLLKAIAAGHGYSVTCHYFNLDFAQQVGSDLFESLCRTERERLDGEWLFAKEAFGSSIAGRAEEYLTRFADDLQLSSERSSITSEQLLSIRDTVVTPYLDGLLEKVAWQQIDVVGFTSTFQQNLASFALARRLKQRWPRIVTLFGGANFEEDMGVELVRSVDVIDFAAIGEADETFPEFLRVLSEGGDPTTVAGIVGKAAGGTTPRQPRPAFMGVHAAPVPDYDDYFTQATELGLLDATQRPQVPIPFESSRGCWWGEKQHCTFCGLNGATMKFRSKSPEHLLTEISELARRYHSLNFWAVDNIMPVEYFSGVFDKVADAGFDFEFFYEIKSNLTREKIRSLHRGGVRTVQPGIEALNTHVLKQMRKGVTAIQNINALRWLNYYGIKTLWQIIWGHHGETEEDYREQVTLMRQLAHLPPPTGFGCVWMERFSPFFRERANFPLKFLRPRSAYQYIYPQTVDLQRAAYFFDHELVGALPDIVYDPLIDLLLAWQEAWKNDPKPSMLFYASSDFVRIEDRRLPNQPQTTILEGVESRLYAACSDRPVGPAVLIRDHGINESTATIERILGSFVQRTLAIQEGGQVLSLAIPASRGR